MNCSPPKGATGLLGGMSLWLFRPRPGLAKAARASSAGAFRAPHKGASPQRPACWPRCQCTILGSNDFFPRAASLPTTPAQARGHFAGGRCKIPSLSPCVRVRAAGGWLRFPGGSRRADAAHAPLHKAAVATAPLPTTGTKNGFSPCSPRRLPVGGAVFPDHVLIRGQQLQAVHAEAHASHAGGDRGGCCFGG